MPLPTKKQNPGTFPIRISLQRGRSRGTPKKVTRQIRMLVDWVIEPEVPFASGKPKGTYLEFSTRTAFMEDDVQVRVQLEGVDLPDSAQVSITLSEMDLVLHRKYAVYTNTPSKFDASDFPFGVFDRPLKRTSDIEAEPFSESTTKILLQTDSANKLSFLMTTINLPAATDEPDDQEYFCIVRITAFNKTLRAASPQLVGHRWWADPGRNLGFRKTNTRVTPLIDGDNYFDAVGAAMASAGSRIFIASWTLDLNTQVGSSALRDVVLAAAGRGVLVCFLLDFHNGRANIDRIKALGSPNIKVRLAVHPFSLPSPIGQFGSYHEKYVCVDTNAVFVGGIDFFPDRHAPVGHATTPNPAFGIRCWHDIGAHVEGVVAHDIERDFIRRWNDGEDYDRATNTLRAPSAADDIPPPGITPRTATAHNCQVVKTDTRTTQPSPIAGPGAIPVNVKSLGTLEVLRQVVSQARHFVYMENQYYRDTDLRDALVDALNAKPDLQAIIVVPFSSEEELALAGVPHLREYSTWQAVQQGATAKDEAFKRATRHGTMLQFQFIDALRKVSNSANRVGVYALATCLSGTPTMVYPHAKIAVVDDTWAYIGSANANGRSLQGTDAEMGVVLHNRADVTAFRKALWKEHLQQDIGTRQVREFVDTWKSAALAGKKKIGDCTCAELGPTHAVDFIDPPKGAPYNGPLQLLFSDDFV